MVVVMVMVTVGMVVRTVVTEMVIMVVMLVMMMVTLMVLGSDDCGDGCPNCGKEVDDNGGGADGNNVVMAVPILAAIISTFTVY